MRLKCAEHLWGRTPCGRYRQENHPKFQILLETLRVALKSLPPPQLPGAPMNATGVPNLDGRKRKLTAIKHTIKVAPPLCLSVSRTTPGHRAELK